jgi:isoquinoline 1-oxidoreductase subunit alpha
MPIAAAANRRVTTIEGLAGEQLHRLQRAWLAEAAPQCGFCHPGMLMQAALLLARNSTPADDEIDAWMAGNLCRCGTYARVRRAIRRAATEVADAG